MPANFPPVPLYPNSYDTSYTLFDVHNSVQTVTTADNTAWSQEISIKPTSSSEIWATNGFATINGELLYYDSVGYSGSGKVNVLKNCVRNLAGSNTQFNPSGTEIYSFVIAEHHNQIAQAIIQIERYLKTLPTLSIPACEEDGDCPQVSFNYNITPNTNSCGGSQLTYNLSIQGNVNNFNLDFGDGTSTTVATSGTHSYAAGANVNPVVTAGNTNCQTVVGLSEPKAPSPTSTFEIPIIVPSIPNISIPSISVPFPDISIPPLVLPYIDISPINISIAPISIGPISIPSNISLIVPSIPNISLIVPSIPNISLIVPSTAIEISVGTIDIPGSISVIADIPSIITLNGSLPNMISIIGISVISVVGLTQLSDISVAVTGLSDATMSVIGLSDPTMSVIGLSDISILCPSCAPISVIVPSIPPISVAWGPIPTLSCNVSVTCQGTSPLGMAARAEALAGNAWDDLGLPNLEVGYDVVGIPSKIAVEAPIFEKITFDTSNFPSKIIVESPNIPDRIVVEGMKEMVSEIKVKVPSELPSFKIDTSGLPKSIPIDWGDVPAKIDLNVVNMPSVISVEHDIPSTITVEGMVDTIQVQGIPDFLPIRFDNPEDRILRVEPIEVKITLDVDKITGKDEDGNSCFRLVPCHL